MPPGLAVGMVVVTNARYAAAYKKSGAGRVGIIRAACNSADGCCKVQLDGQKGAHALDRRFFDVADLPAEIP